MKRRYSNYGSGLLSNFQEIEGSSDYTELPADYYTSSSSSGSGLFDWNAFSTGILNLGDSFVSSYFGKGDSYRATAYSEMLKSEQRTNTILWVVIGLILALGVFLVIRKTK